MSKVVTSPVTHWLGTVVLAHPLNYRQYNAWKDALENATADSSETLKFVDLLNDSVRFEKLIPGLCAVVETSNLAGLPLLTPETFPATPRQQAMDLALWLLNETLDVVTEAETVPNG